MSRSTLFAALVSAPWLAIAVISTVPKPAFACGGFFCQTVPVDQAGEQIVFRQQGNTITAMVRILYTGEAEEFSWVVPVPNTPELSVGSDSLFDQLDFQTRPQFLLETRGRQCDVVFDDSFVSFAPDAAADGEATDSGSVVVEEQVVGPFDVQIVSSDNASDLADWLVANDYDLTSRGEELIAPYVDEGMKFVAVKLRSGVSSGSIQPLIMSYQADKPKIPIRLTAIAAEDDMGVLVWVVADSRAVPENYLHVIPNLGRLNWFRGPFNAYASYQGLITEAMDEAGGQGFATDFAGPISASVTAAFANPDLLQQQLDAAVLEERDAAGFIARAINIVQPTQLALDYLQSRLPAPAGYDPFVYFDPVSMSVAFDPEELILAQTDFRNFVQDRVIDSLRQSIELLPSGAYMTRLYTTLSADEMTLDPGFVYNPAMSQQPVNREAILELACGDNGTEWQLSLGAGTQRDGEVVAQGQSNVPFAPPVAIRTQPAVFRAETTAANTLPVGVITNSLPMVSTGDLTVFSDSVTPANVTVDGNVIFWPDDGWYQVQHRDDYSSVCEGGSSCEVAAGDYVVINHTTGQRIEVTAEGSLPGPVPGSTADPQPVSFTGTTISWPDDGWYEVQNASDFSSVCQGGRQCEVAAGGTYNVINHSSGQRFENIGANPPATPSAPSTPLADTGGAPQVVNNLISWSAPGWYQVQNASTFDTVCEGDQDFECSVAAGDYIVINHSSGERFEDIAVVTGSSTDPEQSVPVTPVAGSNPIVLGSVVLWPGRGYFQLQSVPDFQTRCEGEVNECTVENGTYQLVNHTTGDVWNDIFVTNNGE